MHIQSWGYNKEIFQIRIFYLESPVMLFTEADPLLVLAIRNGKEIQNQIISRVQQLMDGLQLYSMTANDLIVVLKSLFAPDNVLVVRTLGMWYSVHSQT
jgi:hypothetical protein